MLDSVRLSDGSEADRDLQRSVEAWFGEPAGCVARRPGAERAERHGEGHRAESCGEGVRHLES